MARNFDRTPADQASAAALDRWQESLKEAFKELQRASRRPINTNDLWARYEDIAPLLDRGFLNETHGKVLRKLSSSTQLVKKTLKQLSQRLGGIPDVENFVDPDTDVYDNDDFQSLDSEDSEEFVDPDNAVYDDDDFRSNPPQVFDDPDRGTGDGGQRAKDGGAVGLEGRPQKEEPEPLPLYSLNKRGQIAGLFLVTELMTSTDLRAEVAVSFGKHPSEVVLQWAETVRGRPRPLNLNKAVKGCYHYILYGDQRHWQDRLVHLPRRRIRDLMQELADRHMPDAPDKKWGSTAEFADIFDIVHGVLVRGNSRGESDVVEQEVEEVMKVLQDAMQKLEPTPASVLKELSKIW